MEDEKLYSLKDISQTEISREGLEVITMLLFVHCRATNEKLWEDFKDYVKTTSKTGTHKVYETINRIQEYCTNYIAPNEILYRARALKYQDLVEIMNRPNWQELKANLEREFPEVQKFLPSCDINTFMYGIFCLPSRKNIIPVLNKWIEDNKDELFWGFDIKGSGSIKRKSKIKEGRLNKKKQRHLYAAKDIQTALLEIRPTNKQSVSVAEIKILKKLKMFDFTKQLDLTDETLVSLFNDFYFIAEKCSMPNYGDDDYYKPTQEISDYICKLGYDGIIFSSSLSNTGKNILIFENRNIEYSERKRKATFKILNSKIYNITEQKINSQLIFPMSKIQI